MATTSVKLNDELADRLKHLADLKRRTPHWLMVEAINRYIDQEEKRTALYADAMESWRDYEETGEHVTWDEARSWLQSWGTEDEQEPPKCHQ